MLVSHISLVATFVALVSGYLVYRHGCAMIHNGVTVDDGGGWTALLLAESLVSFGAVGIALAG